MNNESAELGAKLEQMLTREEIRDLPVRYCDCIWREDIDGIMQLFTNDAAFVVHTEGKTIEIEGATALKQFYVDSLVDGPRPYIHNHVIDVSGPDRATGRCYLDLRSAKHHFDWLGAGYYEDEYRKVDGRWRFHRRDFFALRIEEWPGDTVKV